MPVAQSEIPINELDSPHLVNKVDVDETADHQTYCHTKLSESCRTVPYLRAAKSLGVRLAITVMPVD